MNWSAKSTRLKPPKNNSRTRQQASILVSVFEDIRKLKNPPVTRAIGFVARSPKRN